ncbi:helicase C-terminal domain-containing protein [Variovorax sp. J22P168]|uniref:helicase C-terminal domain-containing protein n=1 Tax=Variovorax jilinensis TaxID=3053513 RepID=UPI002577D505|nr:helicase C-terminal domain-containing protein [Variovorax sp. J22P168]MDM0014168.1 helicase C-terminal domain-containing protein [Variovorax sp. J22P168]
MSALPSPTHGSDPLAVSVRSLCAFAAKAGDLDLRFVPVPSAQEGQAGHRAVQARRNLDYESEVSLSTRFGRLTVRGRVDGWDPRRRRVEEIKTFRGDFARIKANHRALHWAQARSYAWMLCERDGLESVEVALVYYDLDEEKETVLAQSWTSDELKQHFDTLCNGYLAWAEQEARHRSAVDAALALLSFPHGEFRPGQRALAQAVYRSAMSGRPLLAQAPTGIGKTVATLFPLLKARPARPLDKIFFLTAKTSGRAVALGALRGLGRAQAPLRVLELAAREKVCENPGRACNGDDCPLARGFYDRLPAARSEAVAAAWLDREAVRGIALAHGVCPYFLSQELVRWSDVVVADYNYYFDGSAFLWALAKDEEWRVALLVDEAHNLLERARGMYSAGLDAGALDAVRAKAPAAIRKALAVLDREWRTLQRDQVAAYLPLTQIPERFARALQDAVAVLAEHFAARPDEPPGALQQCFFDLLQFARLADSFGQHSVFEATLGADGARALAIRNLVPAPFLQSRFADAASAACFSGTLAPFDFYRDTLGLPDDTATLDVGSPFHSDQLAVRVAMDLSTRFRDRDRSLAALVDIVGARYAERPGNYLAFFGSFDYLASAAAAFAARHPGVPAWSQSRGMREPEREAFLARFVAGGRGVGFAVLGGAFGEGIDLPGDRLVGAFVASLGLPQHNEPNEVMRERMEALFGDGYAYTYVYPGLQKVVQAAGRVIRSETDAGVLYLLDDRFARREIRALLPAWWRVEPVFALAPSNLAAA